MSVRHPAAAAWPFAAATNRSDAITRRVADDLRAIRARQPLRRDDGRGVSDRVRARVRVRPSRVGAAGALVLTVVPLCHLQRARLPALRRARRSRAVRLAVRGGRPARRPRRSRHPDGPRRRPEHGRVRGVAVRPATSRPGQRRRRLGRRLGLGARRPRPMADRRRRRRRRLPETGHAGDGRRDRSWTDARPTPAQEPALVAGVHGPPARALATWDGQHHEPLPGVASIAL